MQLCWRQTATACSPRAAGRPTISFQGTCVQEPEQQGPTQLRVKELTWEAVAGALCAALLAPECHSLGVTFLLPQPAAAEQPATAAGAADAAAAGAARPLHSSFASLAMRVEITFVNTQLRRGSVLRCPGLLPVLLSRCCSTPTHVLLLMNCYAAAGDTHMAQADQQRGTAAALPGQQGSAAPDGGLPEASGQAPGAIAADEAMAAGEGAQPQSTNRCVMHPNKLCRAPG